MSKEVYFTLVKNSSVLSVDGTDFFPINLTTDKEKFRNKYYEQLTMIINSEKFVIEEYVPMLLVHEYIKDGLGPVYLQSNIGKEYKKLMISALNKFYKDHVEVLDILYTMYVGKNKKINT